MPHQLHGARSAAMHHQGDRLQLYLLNLLKPVQPLQLALGVHIL